MSEREETTGEGAVPHTYEGGAIPPGIGSVLHPIVAAEDARLRERERRIAELNRPGLPELPGVGEPLMLPHPADPSLRVAVRPSQAESTRAEVDAIVREAEEGAAADAAPKGSSVNLEPLRELVRLDAICDALEERLDEHRQRRDAIAAVAMAELDAAGLRSIPLCDADGLPISVHVETNLWTNKRPELTSESACDALEACGLGDMVKRAFSFQTVSAWARRELADGRPLPPAFAGAFDVAEVRKLKTTRVSRRESESARAARNLRRMRSAPPDPQ